MNLKFSRFEKFVFDKKIIFFKIYCQQFKFNLHEAVKLSKIVRTYVFNGH